MLSCYGFGLGSFVGEALAVDTVCLMFMYQGI